MLDELAADHEIVRKVLEYRQLTKLKGTYVDALPALIDPATGRLHTSFNQAGAATGRLSSSNPNLQNIPIRTALGREIRAAFVPREGWKLLVADYSQIELRLLAHMSDDELLVDAFRNGEDIHTRTAAEVMGVPPMMVTPEARRDAKAVNFGIVYGISGVRPGRAVGHLARGGRKVHQELFRALRRRAALHRRHHRGGAAHRRDANAVRARAAHPGHQQPQPERARIRRTYRGEFAAAGNRRGPDQAGDGADRCRAVRGGYQAAMLLQVHDELVFECPPEELDAVSPMVKREMEGVYVEGAAGGGYRHWRQLARRQVESIALITPIANSDWRCPTFQVTCIPRS